MKTILGYLQGTQDLGLWYSRKGVSSMVGYVDAGYMSDPHNARSQLVLCFSVVVQPSPGAL